VTRRLEPGFGPRLEGSGGVRFSLWAPDASAVRIRLHGPGGGQELPLEPAGDGWFVRHVPEAGAGTRYAFHTGRGPWLPDPASRFQPEGVHGPSEVIDASSFAWPDADWRGRPWEETVLQEIHVGAFSSGGRYRDVESHLDALAGLGVTALELMPLAECPGARNWGYDGVLPWAPARRYGRPEELRALVAAAHARGLVVLLDVVYNHFGPDGNYLGLYASPFFTERHHTPWGAAIDFAGPASAWVREFFIGNAIHWVRDYGFDGLRLDAVHAIHDESRPDVLAEMARRVREAAGGRHVHLVLENEHNESSRLLRDARGAPRSYTAQWNDDIHHAFHVLLTGESDGYYGAYADTPARHLGRCLAEGFSWQGEPFALRGGRPRGEPSAALPPTAFVSFLQNHDQIGNRALGERLTVLAPAEGLRAAKAVLLLAPQVPMLFMGEEWGAREPFLFFCDFEDALADAVRDGRRREFAAFPAFRDPAARARIPDPGAEATFRASVLDRTDEGGAHQDERAFHAELLELRRREIVPRLHGLAEGGSSWRELGPCAVEVCWHLAGGARLHLRTHLGPQPAPGPAAPLPGRLLYALPAGAASAGGTGPLPAWSVCFHLETPEDAR